NEMHCTKLLELLNAYMEDEMGMGKPMPKDLGPEIIAGLKKHSAYLGFFVCVGEDYVALANCNLNFSDLFSFLFNSGKSFTVVKLTEPKLK
ncbi:hypothetical protein N9164_17035, partial [Draconibacterium sp.]|nr:hypothetical protein [Draconibacterium sp.]